MEKRKDSMWLVIIIVLLLLMVSVSTMFYFSFVSNYGVSGHVVSSNEEKTDTNKLSNENILAEKEETNSEVEDNST